MTDRSASQTAIARMSAIIPNENERTDPSGRPLVAPRRHDVFRRSEVWAVYRFLPTCRTAEARCSKFVSMTMAREAADELNRARANGQTHYFRVYRLASILLDSNGAQNPQTI
jgi:hypothetical protein